VSGKILSGLIVGFWGVMMVALVRWEYLGKPTAFEAVPAQRLVEKILSHSSPARLNVLQFRAGRTNWIGYCRLDVAKEERDGAAQLLADARVNLAAFGLPARLHLTGNGLLNSQNGLRQFHVQADFGDGRVDIQSADAQRVDVVIELGQSREARSFNLRDFQAGALGIPGLSGVRGSPSAFRVGYERLAASWGGQRAYAVEYRLDAQSWVKAWISELGEILVVETPWGVTLVDDQLLTPELREQAFGRQKRKYDSDRTAH